MREPEQGPSPEEELPGERDASVGGYDLRHIVVSPVLDGEWPRKHAITGALTLVPVLGSFHLFGWALRFCQESRQTAPDLPEPALAHVFLGARAFLALLPLALPTLVLHTLLTLLADVRLVGWIFGMLAFVLAVSFSALVPAIVLVFLDTGDLLASIRFEKLRAHAGGGNKLPYAILVVTLWVLPLGPLLLAFLIYMWLSPVLGPLAAVFPVVVLAAFAPALAAMSATAIAEFEQELRSAETEDLLDPRYRR